MGDVLWICPAAGEPFCAVRSFEHGRGYVTHCRGRYEHVVAVTLEPGERCGGCWLALRERAAMDRPGALTAAFAEARRSMTERGVVYDSTASAGAARKSMSAESDSSIVQTRSASPTFTAFCPR